MPAVAPPYNIAAQEEDGYITIAENELASLSIYMPSVDVRKHYSDDYVVAWIKLVTSDDATDALKEIMPRGMPNVGSSFTIMCFYAANTRFRQIQLLSVALYNNKEGMEIVNESESFSNYRWKECVPGSVEDTLWEVLMEAAGL